MYLLQILVEASSVDAAVQGARGSCSRHHSLGAQHGGQVVRGWTCRTSQSGSLFSLCREPWDELKWIERRMCYLVFGPSSYLCSSTTERKQEPSGRWTLTNALGSTDLRQRGVQTLLTPLLSEQNQCEEFTDLVQGSGADPAPLGGCVGKMQECRLGPFW